MSIKTKFFVGAFAAAFVFFGASVANAAYMHTVTLKQGSSGSQVMSLQQTLNMTSCALSAGAGSAGFETTTFGPKTKAAVQCFQAANGLVADGIVGPATGAKLAMVVGGGVSTPSAPCPVGYVCTPTGGNTGSTGGLSGGAGDLNISSTSTDVEDSVNEGEEDVKIFGIEVEADGSDIAITSIKVSFQNNGYASSSENFNRYVDEVTVWLGDEQVGSADASDFSRDTGTPDEYSATISLSGAVVDEDDEEKLYVAVTAVDTIETADQNGASWDIQLESLRFNDATGAILSGDVSDVDTYAENDDFTFDDSSEDDDIELKSSSSNPKDSTVKVDEDDETDDVLALVARLDNDEDSSDASLFDIPVQIKLDNYGSDADTAEDIISKVVLSIDGDEYEGDLAGVSANDDFDVSDGGDNTNGDVDDDGTTPVYAIYNFDIDGETVVDAGDVVDVKVFITFNDQDGNYAQNTLVTAKIGNDEIDAENEDGDEMDVDGSDRTGAVLTLNTSTAVVTVTKVESDKNEAATVGTFSFTIKIEADGDDVTFDADDDIAYTVLGTDTSATSAVFSFLSGDATDNGSNSYTIAEGDDATFSFDVTHDPDNAGVYRVRLDEVAGQDMGDDEIAGPQTLSAS